jgi:hypothetical protein
MVRARAAAEIRVKPWAISFGSFFIFSQNPKNPVHSKPSL